MLGKFILFILLSLFSSVPGGELFERIVAEEYLMEDDAVDYVRQILEALQFMHERNFVHLDLKVRGTFFPRMQNTWFKFVQWNKRDGIF